jgi:glycosyltransferase involved in cell wall biosynthesis
MPQSREFSGDIAAPRVSVVTPVHNRKSLIPDLLAMLQKQTFTDFELVIVDDGSTDGLEEAVAAAVAAFPIRFVRLARNRGAAAAQCRIRRGARRLCGAARQR